MLLQNRNKQRKGAALVEYALLIAGVALVCIVAVAIFGHKTNDMIAATAAVLPGAHAGDNGQIVSGKIIETTGATTAAGPPIALNMTAIVANSGTARLGNRLGLGSAPSIATLVIDP